MQISKVIDAEAWGLMLGLKMVVAMTRDKIMVECDSEVLFGALGAEWC